MSAEDIYLDVFEKVINENLLFLVLVILSPHADVEAHDQGAHQVVLPAVPQPFGGVAHHGLQKHFRFSRTPTRTGCHYCLYERER